MIGRLTGTLLEKQPPLVLIDVGGVGYEVEAPMSTFYGLPSPGEKVTLYTHLAVREDAHLLFGFASEQERVMFKTLIKVNGVGAKLALTILSGISAVDFSRCVQEQDTATLIRLPGIGKKMAERLVVEMRDRLDKLNLVDASTFSSTVVPLNAEKTPVSEAVNALVALGYKPNDASRMVRSLDTTGLTCEDVIRQALKSAIS